METLLNGCKLKEYEMAKFGCRMRFTSRGCLDKRFSIGRTRLTISGRPRKR